MRMRKTHVVTIMASIFAWPSVSVVRGGRSLVARKIVKCEWTDTFGGLLEKTNRTLVDANVDKVQVNIIYRDLCFQERMSPAKRGKGASNYLGHMLVPIGTTMTIFG